MQDLLQYLTTFSVALGLPSVIVLAARRYVLAATGFIALGSGSLGMVWDSWTARTGHHMQLIALLNPVPLSNRDCFLIITHVPFLLLGFAVLALATRARTMSEAMQDL